MNGVGESTSTQPDSPSASTSLLASGSQIGRFLVLHRLGEGAMGVVYAGYDVQLDRKVAIKVIRDEIASDRLRQRTLREALALAKLSHPNVVHVYEVGEHRRRLFVAMEFIDGQDLRTWLKSQTRSYPEILATIAAAGRGLAAAHAIGLIHRDVKPDNILVGGDGRARIADFGLVRVSAGASEDLESSGSRAGRSASWEDVQLTQEGRAIGTPAYMAPEQHAGAAVGPAADTFSLCVTAYEALYGARPFAGRTTNEVRAAILAGEIAAPPPESRVPRWIYRALLRGLEVDPAARWPSVDALLDALERDPTRRWRLAAAATATVATVAIGSFTLATRIEAQAQRCQGAREELAGVWDAEQRSQALGAILGSQSPLAAETAPRVGRVLDAYADAWVETHMSMCEEHRRGAISPVLLDRAMACLARRRGELGALVRVLAEPAEGTVENAIQAASSLPRVGRCGDAEVLLAATPPPEDAATAAKVAALQGELDRVRALEGAGRYEDGLVVLDAIATGVVEIGYSPLRAEWSLRRGILLLWLRRYSEASVELKNALVTANRIGLDEMAAEAIARWLFVSGYGLGRIAEADAWYPLARAWAERLADPREVLAELANDFGSVHYAAGRLTASVESYNEALALWIELRGERHPQVSFAYNNLGDSLIDLGRCGEAQGVLARAERLCVDLLGELSPGCQAILDNRCRIFDCLGDRGAARSCLEERMKGAAERDSFIAMAVSGGKLEFDAGELDAAAAHFTEILERTAHEVVPERAVALAGLARVALVRAEHDRADALFSEATALLTEIGMPGELGVDIDSGLAEVLLARGEVDAAVGRLTALLEREAALDRETPWLLARPRFALARALAGDSARRGEALALARRASADLADGGHQRDGERARIAAWVASLGE